MVAEVACGFSFSFIFFYMCAWMNNLEDNFTIISTNQPNKCLYCQQVICSVWVKKINSNCHTCHFKHWYFYSMDLHQIIFFFKKKKSISSYELQTRWVLTLIVLPDILHIHIRTFTVINYNQSSIIQRTRGESSVVILNILSAYTYFSLIFRD